MPNSASVFLPLQALVTAQVFTHRIEPVTFDHIPDARAAFSGFFQRAGIPPDASDAYLLTMSEILTNLVKHPARPPRFAEIAFRADKSGAVLDISDDATSFADFHEKCQAALDDARQLLPLAESGHGLRCILRQHTEALYTPAATSRDGCNHFSVRDFTREEAS